MQPHKTTLHVTWKWLAAFLSLTILCGTSHEFVHHFSGAAVCGGFGVKTFNSFDLIPGCGGWREIVANLAGPAFTFALMWWGAALLFSPAAPKRRIGLALIFANFPINRLFFVLIRANDEYWSAHQMFGNSVAVHIATVAIVWLVALPPVLLGLFTIGNSPKWAWFLALFILPFVFVLLFAGIFLENYLLLQKHVLASSLFGVPWLIILTELIALLFYATFKKDLGSLPLQQADR